MPTLSARLQLNWALCNVFAKWQLQKACSQQPSTLRDWASGLVSEVSVFSVLVDQTKDSFPTFTAKLKYLPWNT